MIELDRALDSLYAESPENFTKKRDELAKSATDAEEKKALKARRRPTQVAYVLNQLSRRHAESVAELVDVGRELARAQRRALRDDGASGLREIIARQREVVARLTKETATVMRDLEIAPEGHLGEIAAALQAALVDPTVGAALEEGRLEKVPEATASFGDLTTADVPLSPREEERHARRSAEDAKESREAAKREREREKEEAKRRAEEAAREARQKAQAAAREAIAEAERLDEEATALEAKAEEARREADRALKHAQALAKRAG